VDIRGTPVSKRAASRIKDIANGPQDDFILVNQAPNTFFGICAQRIVGIILKLISNMFEANIGGIDSVTKTDKEIYNIGIVNTVTSKLDGLVDVLTEADKAYNPS
jgi:hypothetical protein